MPAGNNICLIHEQIKKLFTVATQLTQDGGVPPTAARGCQEHDRTWYGQTGPLHAKALGSGGIEGQCGRGGVDQVTVRDQLLRNLVRSQFRKPAGFYIISGLHLIHIYSSSVLFSSSFSRSRARVRKAALTSESGSPSITVMPRSSHEVIS